MQTIFLADFVALPMFHKETVSLNNFKDLRETNKTAVKNGK
jgi:hypothetical protein